MVSFDLNFREKLWKFSGGPEHARSVIQRIVENVDVLVGNEEDLQKGLGIAGPEVTAKSKLDPGAFFGMIDQVIAQHPHIKIVATTLREVHSTNRHAWSAVAWMEGQTHVAPTCHCTFTIALAAAMASLPDSFTVCWRVSRPKKLSR